MIVLAIVHKLHLSSLSVTYCHQIVLPLENFIVTGSKEEKKWRRIASFITILIRSLQDTRESSRITIITINIGASSTQLPNMLYIPTNACASVFVFMGNCLFHSLTLIHRIINVGSMPSKQPNILVHYNPMSNCFTQKNITPPNVFCQQAS